MSIPIEKRLVLVGLLATTACAHKYTASYAPSEVVAADSKSAPADYSGAAMPMEEEAPPAKPAVAKQPRMVHYDGYAKLKVTSPEETLDAAVRIAEGAKGYVESRAGNTVNLRVPVASIREVYAQVLGLGDVLARSLKAADITNAFLAAELRLKTLRASRDRLVDLLPGANEQQKIGLLREIQRLTEQVVALEVQVRTLQQLAVFSRITVEAVPRQPHSTSPVDELAAFRWIHELSPVSRTVARRGDTLELEAPKDMVVLDEDDTDDVWVAESADGVTVWTSKQENEPHGDTSFWIAALKARLAKDYPSVEEVSIGRFSFVRMVDEKYRYLVGVMADDDDLQVVEIYYPSPELEERYGPGVKATVERGET
ncbi:MAG: DUF4349 domain-containing protein [Myxococcota bacterium]